VGTKYLLDGQKNIEEAWERILETVEDKDKPI